MGLWLVTSGSINFIFKFVIHLRMVERFKLRCVFIANILCSFPAYIMFPFENLASSHVINPAAPGMLILLQLSPIYFSISGFGKCRHRFFLIVELSLKVMRIN